MMFVGFVKHEKKELPLFLKISVNAQGSHNQDSNTETLRNICHSLIHKPSQ